MKKLFFSVLFSQITIFCLADDPEQITREIQDKKIIEKVENHESLIKRLEWTSPFFLAPTLVAVGGLCYTLWLYFYGINKKANEILQSVEMKVKMEKLMTEALNAEEKRIKAKPFFLLFLPDRDMKNLTQYLKDAGFKGIKPQTLNDSIEPDSNEIIIFNDENKDMLAKIVPYIEANEKVRTKARYFYFGPQRFEHEEIKMTNSANFRDALIARLYESLKAID